ncbi:type II toxin-antitoxin system VapB family antitoxin [Candidatus Parcubacteria bacterium]|nr:MAG: type II toxin-antitoxin system VapB family antitoxin [Candidatus Parcubacteria bacterium]
MTTDKWKLIEPRTVRIEELEFQQDHLSLPDLVEPPEETFTGDEYPYIVDYQGKLYVEDGHHRIVRHKLSGHKTIKARVHRKE